MTRMCLICYKYTRGNLPFCYEHYKQFQDVIDPALKERPPWLVELEKLTQRERRRVEKSRWDKSLSVLGEEVFDDD